MREIGGEYTRGETGIKEAKGKRKRVKVRTGVKDYSSEEWEKSVVRCGRAELVQNK